MASKSGTLRVRLVGDSKPLEKTLSGMGDKVKKFGALLAAGGAAAAAGGVLLVKHAGQLEATARKAATVFEDQLGGVEKWANENANAMGLTSSELTGLTANFADLLKPMGFTAAQAADMSMDVNGLAGALAEWSGGQYDAAGASEILAKAMLGERESLKSLGISITEADVKARLAAKGQDELTGAALEQAKAIATQELIMEKSTDAQQAFADGSDTLQRKQAQVTATLKEMRDKGLKAMMPLAHQIANWASDMLPKAMDATKQAFAAVSEFVKKNVVPILERLSDWWKQNGPAIIAAGQALMRGVKRAFDGIVGAVQFVMRNWDKFKVAIGIAVGVMIPHFVAMGVAAFVSAVKVKAAFVVTQAAAIKAAVSNSVAITKMVAGWVLVGAKSLLGAAKVAASWLIALGPVALVIAAVVAVVAVIVKNWDTIKEVIAAGWNWVKDKTSAFVGWVVRTWRSMWDRVTGLARTAIEFVKSIPGRIMEGIRSLASTVANFVIKYHPVAILLRKAREFMPEFIGFVRGIPGRIVSGLGKIGSLLVNKGKDLIRGLWNGIRSMGSWLANKIIGFVTDKIPGPIAKALGIQSPSKVAAALARQVPKGLVVGMEAEARTLERAAERMALSALPELGVPEVPALPVRTAGVAGAGGGRDGGRGGDTYHITISAPNYVGSKQELMDVVRAELSKDARRNVPTFR